MQIIYYLKKYPFSIAIIVIVIYLSFFKPPSVNLPLFEGFDKFVHFCMYGGMSGILWLEFLFNHRKSDLNVKHAITGAVICPIVFSGFIELGQEYFTVYRGGDWLDFLANISGVFAATFIAWYIFKPLILKNKR